MQIEKHSCLGPKFHQLHTPFLIFTSAAAHCRVQVPAQPGTASRAQKLFLANLLLVPRWPAGARLHCRHGGTSRAGRQVARRRALYSVCCRGADQPQRGGSQQRHAPLGRRPAPATGTGCRCSSACEWRGGVCAGGWPGTQAHTRVSGITGGGRDLRGWLFCAGGFSKLLKLPLRALGR